jgi:hypothetical protein
LKQLAAWMTADSHGGLDALPAGRNGQKYMSNSSGYCKRDKTAKFGFYGFG